ncbi:MAG: FtsQ-type POTRA domain-containing protein [bacterium]|nr:FtsQ-type POTRA domain-containing protein [bacterium]
MLRRHRYYKPKPRLGIGHGRGSAAKKQSRRTHTLPDDAAHGKVRAVVGVIFFAASFFWFGYFFLFSDSFEAKTIVVSGNRTIPKHELSAIVAKELDSRRWMFLPARNMLLLPEERIQEAIREQYIVDHVGIARDWPFSVHIAIEEKLSRVILRVKNPVRIINEPRPDEEEGIGVATSTNENVSHNNVTETEEQEREVRYTESYHLLDVNGIVVASGPVSELDLQELPIIEIIPKDASKIKPGLSVLSRDVVELIFELYQRIGASSKSISLAHVSYDTDISQELSFTTQEGWQAILSTQIPLETQIQKLELALQEKIQDNRSTLQYVDLRVPDRVYFK